MHVTGYGGWLRRPRPIGGGLAPEESRVAWMKFRVKDPVPPRFALVVDYIHLPLKGLVPTVGASACYPPAHRRSAPDP